MLAKRIIPCLDVKDGRVVKGVRFQNHEDVGDIVDLATRYSEEGADELVFYDISASPQSRTVEPEWVGRVAQTINIPFCVAGGIRSVDDARARLFAGADKISINTPALENPDLVDTLAREFGTQCVVVGIDSRVIDGRWRWSGSPRWSSAAPARSFSTAWTRTGCARAMTSSSSQPRARSVRSP